MALSLDTGHALYGNIKAFICVDDDDVIKDLKGDTCTPHENVTIGSGTYGRHFNTFIVSSNAQGVALTTGFVTSPNTVGTGLGTTFVVVNSISSVVSRGAVLNTALNHSIGPAVSGGKAAALNSNNSPELLGTSTITSGAHSFGVALNNSSGAETFADGSIENTRGTRLGTPSDSNISNYIGGVPSGGYGGCAAAYVYVVQFDKHLSSTEISDLHTSLGASNAFALLNISVSAATATTLAGPTSGTTGVASTNFTVGADGTITGTVTVTPAATGGGTFSPTSVAISSGTPTGTFTYTPGSDGAKTISTTNSGSLTNPTSITYTASAGGDVTRPVLTGSIVASAITTTSYTLTWPAGSDAVGVTGYDYSLNAGSTWTSLGNVLTVNITGRTPGATDSVQVRARDAAGNLSTPVLSASVNLLASGTGTLTLPVLKNNTGTVLASETGATAYVYATTGALVVTKTAQTTNGSGIMTLTDALIVAATTYRVVIVLAGGAEGMDKVVAA